MSDYAAETDAPSACIVCGHRAIWHHDERGCEYHGNSPARRCRCLRTSDQVVARIVSEAMRKVADVWLDISTDAHPTTPGATS